MEKKRVAKKCRANQEAREPKTHQKLTMLQLEDNAIKIVSNGVIKHLMTNAGVVFNSLGSKQPQQWESEEKPLYLLLENLGGQGLSLVNFNVIGMTETVLATKTTEVFKSTTDTKDQDEPEEDKGAEIEKLSQELNTLNGEIKWIIVKLKLSEIESASVLKFKLNKNLKTQMKVLNQNIEESQFPDPEQLDLSPEVTLQIAKKPKINNTITLDKRLRLLSKQKLVIREEEKVEDSKAKANDAKDKKVEETVEQELLEWEQVKKKRWILRH